MSRLNRLFGSSEERLLALEERLKKQAERLDAQRTELKRQRERLDKAEQRSERQRARLREHLRAQQEVGSELSSELARLGAAYPVLEQQMSSFEARLQQAFDAAANGDLEASDAERTEARNLLDEVRREHSQIRVRFGVVSRYEERVRRLEAAIEPTPDQFSPSRDAADAG